LAAMSAVLEDDGGRHARRRRTLLVSDVGAAVESAEVGLLLVAATTLGLPNVRSRSDVQVRTTERMEVWF
jgi:hypothetical protein